MSTTTNTTLAGPLAACCATGFKHTGEPAGRRETIGGIETYVTDPPAATSAAGPKRVIIYFADVFGAFFINSKLLQDYFASQGFHVVGIDYLFGDYIQDNINKPGFNMLEWGLKKFARAREVTPAWIDAVREKYGQDALYCCTGYCFGAPFSMDLAATDKVVAAAFGHPSALDESHFRALKAPLLLSCAETDSQFPTESRHKAEAILAETKATYHLQVFAGVSHGFVSRGDISEEPIRWAREQSAASTVAWFNRFTAKP